MCYTGLPMGFMILLFNQGLRMVSDQGKFSLTNYTVVVLSFLYELVIDKKGLDWSQLIGSLLVLKGLYTILVTKE